MTDQEVQELQDICDRIQNGERTAEWYPVKNDVDKKKRVYYDAVMINGIRYKINLDRKIVIEDVEI